MKERPILFSGPMVRAILEGRKTQARRVFPRKYLEWIDEPRGPEDIAAGYPFICGFDSDEECISALQLCPYGQPGDRLWVREAWHQKGEWRLPEYPEAEWEDAYWVGTKEILYATDKKSPGAGWRTRPSIHMPRWACRLVLEITDVRVERLQDISEEDARAEGATSRPHSHGDNNCNDGWSMDWSRVSTTAQWDKSVVLNESDLSLGTARWAFAAYVNELHGGKYWNLKPTLWDANPWVWAINFKVVTP